MAVVASGEEPANALGRSPWSLACPRAAGNLLCMCGRLVGQICKGSWSCFGLLLLGQGWGRVTELIGLDSERAADNSPALPLSLMPSVCVFVAACVQGKRARTDTMRVVGSVAALLLVASAAVAQGA